ncbi:MULTISPECIES: protein-disulfide reductase DsbD domain-containing protein [unclassified Xanthobacter]|uniref:protein-disulfide reductase DsbD domain-containing protein n=1 Tax=unclassified Xanthobacter TaxID=2623496 RepID=UPI001EDEA098|nr:MULTISPECIES: protein-disulfide reductase DsbD domain-containing protein [unclassified Xanthobacter]
MIAPHSTRARRRPKAPWTTALLALSALLMGAALSVAQAEPSSVTLPGVTVRLFNGGGTADTRDVGLELQLQTHWKTYWRYPGDSGVPPMLAFEQSENVADVAVGWPAPRRFADGAGGFSIGYKGTVVLPLTVTLKDPSQPAKLVLGLDFAVCEALCMPATADLTLDLAAEPDPGAAARIAAARARIPEPQAVGVAGTPQIVSARLDTGATPPQLVVDARDVTPKADLFAEGPDHHWALPLPQKVALADGLVRFTLPLEGVPPDAALPGAVLTLTLVDMPRSVTAPWTIPAP